MQNIQEQELKVLCETIQRTRKIDYIHSESRMLFEIVRLDGMKSVPCGLCTDLWKPPVKPGVVVNETSSQGSCAEVL